MSEDEEKVMDFYCIWWKRDDACRFGTKKKQEMEFFIVQKMYLMGRVRVHPFSDYKPDKPERGSSLENPYSPCLLASFV